jgi:hypothetical protein
MSGGTWMVTSANKGVVLDTACIVSTINFKVPPSAWEAAAYDPVTNLPTAGRFTLIDGTPPNGVFSTNWPWVPGVPVTITPTPPTPQKRGGSLWCSSVPVGAEFEIVTL